MEGQLRKIITDKGVFYYRIKLSSIFDYLFLYRKKTPSIWVNFVSFFYQSFKYTSIPAENIEFSNGDYYTYLNKKGNRLDNIMESINKILIEYENFDPTWDGIMIKDKSKLRELVIDDLLEQ